MTINDIAIVVMSCDAYQDVAEHFFNLKEKYMPWWTGKCYYVNEVGKYKRKNVITINAGNERNWSGRLKYALNTIPEKYILYMQEDYLIDKPVLKEDFLLAIDYIQKNRIWYYKIDNLPKIKMMIDNVHSRIPSNIRYGINLLTAIIEKKSLIELLPSEDSSAWQVESGFLKNVTDEYEYDLEGCVLNTKPIISVCYGVRHGKWIRKVLRHFKSNGYIINPRNRRIMGFFENFDLNFKDFISHRLTTKQVRKLKRLLIKLNFNFISKEK